MFARFPFSLRRFLAHRLTLDEAERIVRRGMEQREENFLRLVERGVYGYPRSPYLALLKHAQCELGDLRTLVAQKGLEDALRALREAGVYITFEEFKGRKPIVRRGLTLPVKPSDFDNPHLRRDLTMHTGGSSGAAVNVGINLDFVAARAPHLMVILAAHGLLETPMVRWDGILPSNSVRIMLQMATFGLTVQHWFSPGKRRDSKYWVKYSLASYYVLLWMRLYGIRVPFPKFVRVEDAAIVARCVGQVLKENGKCAFASTVSRNLRVLLEAQKAGIDLKGATFSGFAEPPTPAKVQPLIDAGIKFINYYATAETNYLGMSCAAPQDSSDVHLFKDAFALFTYPYELPDQDTSVPAFNLTTLLPTSSKLMLNVQIDDYGIVEERHCGCPLEAYGYTTHLRDIRSYSKLVGEGVTLIGNELLGILETVLPARFGGSALDYQLLEQEDEKGFTRLYLVISPRVRLGVADEGRVIQVMLNALRDSSPMADAARTIWQNAQTVQIKRMEPILTARGKLLPLHIQKLRRN